MDIQRLRGTWLLTSPPGHSERKPSTALVSTDSSPRRMSGKNLGWSPWTFSCVWMGWPSRHHTAPCHGEEQPSVSAILPRVTSLTHICLPWWLPSQMEGIFILTRRAGHQDLLRVLAQTVLQEAHPLIPVLGKCQHCLVCNHIEKGTTVASA